MNNSLTNISPIDGRYESSLVDLKKYFSEFALFKSRTQIEIKYLLKLISYEIAPKISNSKKKDLINIAKNFSLDDALEIKTIEKKINHDVKAIEYFLQSQFKKKKLKNLSPFIHLGLTSEDVNNLAYSLLLRDFEKVIVEKEIIKINHSLKGLVEKYKNSPILGRTHGQPAVPTTFGKELSNYLFRLKRQQKKLVNFKFEGKLNGAVGCFNALAFVYPKVDWLKFSKDFILSLGLEPNLNTTQILPYDSLIEFFQITILINGILLNLCQDFWNYTMLGEIKLRKNEDEVGSSTMPQKVNPIDFENAEGNIQIANQYFHLYEQKLVASRLQRDLSDSTVKRTFGTALGHTVLAWRSLVRGLNKIELDKSETLLHLNEHWEVLSEAVQIFLRSKNDQQAYEKVKYLTRGKHMNKNNYLALIKILKLDKEKINFMELKPEKYIGYASKLAANYKF